MVVLNKALILCTTVLLIGSCELINPPPAPTSEPPVLRGTDFSQLPKIEQEGFLFYNQDSTMVDPLLLLKDRGINCIRLKVWNNPTGDGSLNELIPLVQRIKNHQLMLMLTLHYSNTWADPGQQLIPSQWSNLSHEVLLDSVYDFTRHVTELLKPDYVQIGNEINHGLMHPAGLRNGNGNFQRLLQAGVSAVKSVDTSITTLIHYAGYDNAQVFFQTIDTIDFDAAGLSYYPRWHGKNLTELETACFDLQDDLGRPVFLLETSYPFTLDWADWTNNHIGSINQILDDFPPTRNGQAAFISAMRQISDSLGTGLVYWGGELVPYMGPQSQDGSPYENQALFNFNGVELPVISALGN